MERVERLGISWRENHNQITEFSFLVAQTGEGEWEVEEEGREKENGNLLADVTSPLHLPNTLPSTTLMREGRWGGLRLLRFTSPFAAFYDLEVPSRETLKRSYRWSTCFAAGCRYASVRMKHESGRQVHYKSTLRTGCTCSTLIVRNSFFNVVN